MNKGVVCSPILDLLMNSPQGPQVQMRSPRYVMNLRSLQGPEVEPDLRSLSRRSSYRPAAHPEPRAKDIVADLPLTAGYGPINRSSELHDRELRTSLCGFKIQYTTLPSPYDPSPYLPCIQVGRPWLHILIRHTRKV